MTSKPEFQFYRDELPDRFRAYLLKLERSPSPSSFVKNRPRSRDWALANGFAIKNRDGEFLTPLGKKFLDFVRPNRANSRERFPERPPEVVTKKPKRKKVSGGAV